MGHPGGGGLRLRRRPHRLPRVSKERRTRGSVWLRSPLMGLTAEDSRQQAMSQDEEEASISTSSSIDTSSSDSDYSQDYKSESHKPDNSWQHQYQQLLLVRRREGLLDITMRTVNLMRRNQQLQHRLAALQAETRAFVRSVLSNPENKAIRELTTVYRRKEISESDEENSSAKRMKSDDETSSLSSVTTTDTTSSITKMDQDPAVSEGDGDI